MNSKADEFLGIYNKFDRWIRDTFGLDQNISYTGAISKAQQANKSIRQYERFLKQMGLLRNAIIHDEEYPNEIIAEPKLGIVEKFGEICTAIYNPPTAYELCNGRKPEILPCDAFLTEALGKMYKNDYSQIIIKNNDNSYGLLTRESVSKWVEANIEQDIISIQETRLDDVTQHEGLDVASFVSRKASIFDVRDIFSCPERIIQAVIVTETGKKTEKPLGILTPSDMMKEAV